MSKPVKNDSARIRERVINLDTLPDTTPAEEALLDKIPDVVRDLRKAQKKWDSLSKKQRRNLINKEIKQAEKTYGIDIDNSYYIDVYYKQIAGVAKEVRTSTDYRLIDKRLKQYTNNYAARHPIKIRQIHRFGEAKALLKTETDPKDIRKIERKMHHLEKRIRGEFRLGTQVPLTLPEACFNRLEQEHSYVRMILKKIK